MILIEIFNACSMIFPFFAFRKHRKRTKSALKHVMCLHIPASFLFHSFKAFSRKKLTKVFFSIDIILIHISSILTSYEYRRISGRSIKPMIAMIPIHGLSYMNSIVYTDFPMIRCGILAIDNGIIALHERYGKRVAGECSACILFYILSFRSRLYVGHTIFHMFLYNVYDIYFKIYSV